jgi:hypothetical protein
MKNNVWLATALALGLASCAVGPNYKPRTSEQLNAAAAWHATLPEGARSGDLSTGRPLDSPGERRNERPLPLV